jgi:hypothetical protein
MISATKGYELILRCIKAIAGKGKPQSCHNSRIEQLGIITANEVKQLKNLVVSEVANEGYEFTKMSLDSIQPSSTVDELVQLVTHATPKSYPKMY